MAFRTWGRLLLTALGVSVLAGAGQLGVAFGFGIVRLTGAFTGDTVNQWPAQLVWVGWFAANAAVAGAVLTERLARRDGQLTGTGGRLAVAGAAALGATVVAPLCMQPARSAELISVDPVWAVGICAVLGAVAGAGAALAVLVRPPTGWNMAVLAGAVWLVALLSVGPSLGADGPLRAVRLGVLEPPGLSDGATQRLALLIPPTVALIAGAVTGALARWRGHPPVVGIPTGVAGPVLVAFAYLTSGPGDAADRYQLSPYYGALIAVATGALGSAAAALLPWPVTWPTGSAGAWTTSGSTGARPAGQPGTGTRAEPGDGDRAEPAVEPTDILQPLPAGPPLPRPGATPSDGPADTVGAGLAPLDGTGGTPDRVTGEPSRSAPPHWDWPTPAAVTPPPADFTPPAAFSPPADFTPPATVRGTDSPAAANASPPAVASSPTDGVRATGSPAKADAAPPTDVTPDAVDAVASPADATPDDTYPPADATPDAAARPADPTPDAAARPAPAGPPPGRPRSHETAGPPAGRPHGHETTAHDVTGQPPRPRHHALLPDLGRAGTWDAFGTTHRAGSDAAGPAGVEASPAAGAGPAGNATVPPAGGGGSEPQFPDPSAVARDLTAAFANPPAAATTPPATPPPAGTDTAGDGDAVGKVAAEDRSRARRGLFRRPKSRAGQDRPAERDAEPLPAQDEEYVDWVAGLSRPVADNEPEQESGRRSLRSSGRHHRN